MKLSDEKAILERLANLEEQVEAMRKAVEKILETLGVPDPTENFDCPDAPQ